MSKKRLAITVSCIASVALIAGIIYVATKPGIQAGTTSGSVPASTVADVNAPKIDNSPSVAPTKETSTSEITVDVGGDASKPAENITPAKEPAKPVTPSKPAQSTNSNTGGSNNGGITIGDGVSDTGTPETDAFIAELEAKGCPYCGSHTCPSFYAKDEWGNPWYNPRVCPKYDVHKDPLFYCQVCGKKTGDGTNGTCVQFVHDTICPNCGEFVKANTCHTCPEK